MSAFFDGLYSFLLTWEDTRAAIVRVYKMTFYEKKGGTPEIELFDMKKKRIFLKRMPYPSLRSDQLFIGAFVTLYARQMQIVDYGDPTTKARFESVTTLALICQFGPASASALREISAKFNFQNVKLMSFNATEAKAFTQIARADLGPILTSGPVLALELRSRNEGGNCTDEWHALIPTLQQKYRGTFFGASKDVEEKASRFLFASASMGLCACVRNCSVCVVKPHCLIEGNLGGVVTDIVNRGFNITGMRSLVLTKAQAEEFLIVYQNVLPNYKGMVDELSSGTCVAIEVCCESVVQRLRAVAGPIDFPTAKKLRPQSLRAKYGKNSVQSGVHVTDLPEDGVLESEYLFSILPGSA